MSKQKENCSQHGPKQIENILELTREYVGYVINGSISEDVTSNVSRWDEFKSEVEGYSKEFEASFSDDGDYLIEISEFARQKFLEKGWLKEPPADIRELLLVLCTHETDMGIEKFALVCEDKGKYLEQINDLREDLGIEDDNPMFSWDTAVVTVDVSKLKPATASYWPDKRAKDKEKEREERERIEKILAEVEDEPIFG